MFRYWVLPNIPLFLLAAPMLIIMTASGLWGVDVGATIDGQVIVSEKHTLRKLAFPQILLACMAIFSYHVQIITRLSSGCIVWYWWVAYRMSSGVRVEEGTDWSKWVVRYMVVYGVVQSVLFSGFLPPA